MKSICFGINLNGLRIALKTLIFARVLGHRLKISDIGA